MTTELWLLVAAVLLGFAQIVLQAQSMNMQRGYRWNAGPRDEILPPLTGTAGRLNRASRNFFETFPLFAAAILVAATLSCGLTSCFAGPHQLRRSVDDWDHKLYVNSPWIDAVLWVVPVFELANWVAWVGDFIVTDGYTFWFKDAWDGKGTGYEHLKV